MKLMEAFKLTQSMDKKRHLFLFIIKLSVVGLNLLFILNGVTSFFRRSSITDLFIPRNVLGAFATPSFVSSYYLKPTNELPPFKEIKEVIPSLPINVGILRRTASFQELLNFYLHPRVFRDLDQFYYKTDEEIDAFIDNDKKPLQWIIIEDLVHPRDPLSKGQEVVYQKDQQYSKAVERILERMEGRIKNGSWVNCKVAFFSYCFKRK